MQFVKAEIFATLSMSHSAYTVPADLASSLAVGYLNIGPKVDTLLPMREHLGRGCRVPSGGIYTTVGDLRGSLRRSLAHLHRC